MRKFLLRIVRFLISTLTKWQYSHLGDPLPDASDKIQCSYDFSTTQLLINTDTGWEPLSSVHKTRPYEHWKVILKNGYSTRCADSHVFYNEKLQKLFTYQIYAGDLLMTDQGPQEVIACYPTGHYSEMYDTTVMSVNHRYYGDGFLSSNTVMTGIFMAWYILFNIDKNVMVLANKGATAAEIVDKTKTVIKGLPFFMKPGIVQNNVMTMRFDNGCRIMCQSTTKTAAIGFTLHLLFMDEFAHIHNNFIEPFYRSVYPTLSSSNISRVIITSTANGRNKFWEIYQSAIEKKNEYKPFRVDWWQVPGRDEEWKKREIANLGSEELFNQEYGNQFVSSDTLLLSSDQLRYLKKVVKKYTWREIDVFEDEDVKYKDLKWHPNFDIDDAQGDDKFFFSVDLADGVGRDFSVINIFKLESMSKSSMRKLKKDRIEDERSFFRLRQVGMYRSNMTAVEDVAKIAEILFFKLFKTDNIKVAIELNFKGEYFIEKLRKNENFYDEMFLHTRHSEKARYLTMGIRLYAHNKMMLCRELKKLISEKRIIITEETTYNELSAFGINNKGTYSSQSGYDDVAITAMYGSAFHLSDEFGYVVEEMIDSLPVDFKVNMIKYLESFDEKSDDISYVKEFM